MSRKGALPILIIAHRLSAVRQADRIRIVWTPAASSLKAIGAADERHERQIEVDRFLIK